MRKLHITVPEQLFNDLREKSLLGKIDGIIIDLLGEHLEDEDGNDREL